MCNAPSGSGNTGLSQTRLFQPTFDAFTRQPSLKLGAENQQPLEINPGAQPDAFQEICAVFDCNISCCTGCERTSTKPPKRSIKAANTYFHGSKYIR
jgi:hypothetical protein